MSKRQKKALKQRRRAFRQANKGIEERKELDLTPLVIKPENVKLQTPKQ